MSFFAGNKQKVKPQYTGLQVQTSASSVPVTLGWGLNRLAPNVIWYGDFESHKQEQKAGKGGAKVTSYTYSASIILALCQGQIDNVFRVFRNNEKSTDYTSLGFSLFDGAIGQAPWGYLSSAHPTEALSYSGIAYVAAQNYDLGAAASTPQHSFEVGMLRYNTGILANGDADPALCVEDLLTNGEYGAGVSTLDMTQLLSGGSATTTGDNHFQTYCRARGWSMSPVLSSQETAGAILDRWTLLMDTAIVWTGYSIKLIPYGTEEITAHGYHYLPNVTAAYDLNDADFSAQRGYPPFTVNRTDPAEVDNSIKLTLSNRDNEYNEAPVEWKDQGLIDQYQLRQGNGIDAKEITDLDMGLAIVSLYGQRHAYGRNEYHFVLGSEYSLLEPMDILNLIDPSLGTISVWLSEFEEQEDNTFNCVGLEIPPGIVAQTSGAQSITNNPVNAGEPAGDVNDPIVFQPPIVLTNGTPQVWAAVSGVLVNVWGGANVWVSTDGMSYNLIGRVEDPARQGVLTDNLASYGGANPDTVDTLSVDLSMSKGTLQSTTTTEAAAAATLCYVDGEYLSFETATLTAPGEYDLDSLYRGLYGSTPGAHSTGDPLARLDESIFKYTLPSAYIGVTLYFKFQSFNILDGGLQDLADCTEYTFTPGVSDAGVPQNLRSQLGTSTWTGGTLTVVADTVPGANSYQAEFYLDDETTLKSTKVASSPSIPYLSIEAASDGPAREYHVRMRASADGGVTWGNWSGFATFTDTAPAALTGVSAAGGTTTGTVSFDYSADTDLGGYVIFYSQTSGFDPLSEGTAVYNNGFSPQSFFGLPAGTYYALVGAYDNWTAQPDLINLSSEVSFTISTGGGGYVPGDGGGYCVTDDTPILIVENGQYYYKPAKDLVVGDILWTRHETTKLWGEFPIESILFEDSSDVWEVVREGNTLHGTADHRIWIINQWIEMKEIGTPLQGSHRIAKITVTDAHTYVSAGILSHNIKGYL